MKVHFIVLASITAILAGCGGSTKSELTGIWYAEFSKSKPVNVYTTFSEVDKDGNIFVCRNSSDFRTIIPVKDCNSSGMLLKVVDSKNACQTGALGQYCVTYLSGSDEVKFPDGIPNWKRYKGQ